MMVTNRPTGHSNPRRLLTLEEVADRLGVKRSTVYQHAREGVYDAFVVRVGRLVRADPQRLEQWIESGGKPLANSWRMSAPALTTRVQTARACASRNVAQVYTVGDLPGRLGITRLEAERLLEDGIVRYARCAGRGWRVVLEADVADYELAVLFAGALC